MLSLLSRLHLTLAVALLHVSPPLAADQPLGKVEIAKRGKAATVLVEAKEARAYGTAFCIHSSGLFLTNEHVIHPANEGPITLIGSSTITLCNPVTNRYPAKAIAYAP